MYFITVGIAVALGMVAITLLLTWGGTYLIVTGLDKAFEAIERRREAHDPPGVFRDDVQQG